MRILKPEFISHGKHAVYSVDFQPGQRQGVRRLATAGGDSSVKLWDIDALRGEEDSSGADCLLATLEYHSKSVNVCRWSNDGTYLASGSDDTYVIIYAFTPHVAVSQHFGSSAAASKESWSRSWTLHGHRMDVLDIAWSVTNLLASASIDNSIRIWQVPRANRLPGDLTLRHTGEVLTAIRVLNKHSSFVKGVSFDPVGRHLASTGADNKLFLWSTQSWEVVHTVEDPFLDSVDMTMFRRIDWAPDGGSLCITSAVKNSKPIGMSIKRSTWEPAADLVGHDAPTTCCRFYSNVMELNGADNNISPQSAAATCVVALGDQQGVLSVWTTSRCIPVLVIKDLFSDAIVDMTWSSNVGSAGSTMTLGVCSLDGTIGLLFFDFSASQDDSSISNVFGHEMTVTALDKHFYNIYSQSKSDLIGNNSISMEHPVTSGVGSNVAQGGTFSKMPLTIASAQYGNDESRKALSPIALTAERIGIDMSRPHQMLNTAGVVSVTTSPPPRPVITKRPRDGKKRITPMAVSNQSSQNSTADITSMASPSCHDSPSKRVRVSGEHDQQASSSIPTDESTQSKRDLSSNSSSSNYFTSSSSVSSPNQVARRGRAGQLVELHQTVPAGDLNTSEGILQYNFKIDHVVSSYKHGAFGGTRKEIKNDAPIYINIPAPEKSANATGTMWSKQLTSGTSDAKLMISILPRPANVSNAYGAAESTANRGGLGVVSMISLVKPRVVHSPCATHGGTIKEWSVLVPSRVSAGCVVRLPQPLRQNKNPYQFSSFNSGNSTNLSIEGCVILGGTDGTLNILSLSSGVRIYPALSLGAPVVTLCTCSLAGTGGPISPDQTVDDNDLNTYRTQYCMAACADGEIIVWRIETMTYKPSHSSRHSFGSSHSGGIRTAFIAKRGQVFCGLTLMYKANVRPVIQSVRPHTDKNPNVVVDSIFITTANNISLSESAHTEELTLVTVIHAVSAEGGDWQVFRYIPTAGCWTRFGDLKYLLSFSGVSPCVSHTAISANSCPVQSNGTDMSYLDLELEALPSKCSLLKTQDVAAAAKLLQQEKIQEQLGRCTGRMIPSSTDDVNSLSAFDWGWVVSLSNAEDKLSSFFFELSVHDKYSSSVSSRITDRAVMIKDTLQCYNSLSNEALIYWTREWVKAAAQLGFIQKIKWLGERLLDLLRKLPSSQTSPREIQVDVDDSNGDNNVLKLKMEKMTDVDIIKWQLSTSAEVSIFLKDTLLPAIANCGVSTNPSIQSLLQQIDDAHTTLKNLDSPDKM